jgi:hypothetical protein
MKLDLPEPIQQACAPLFDMLPLDQAMPHLLGSHLKHADLVLSILNTPAMQGRNDLAAGLWLYVDDLDRSHTISQGIETPTGSLLHGIMHRREGDFSNSHYWMRRAASHPLFAELDPASLIDRVSAARGQDLPELLVAQRTEWAALFSWCANNPE